MIKSIVQTYINGLKNIFKLKWRMSKYDFCAFLTVHFFVCLLVHALFFKYGTFYLLFILLILLTIVPYLAMGHRLQDMGKSGFTLIHYLFAFLLCYGICVIIVGYSTKFIYPSKDLMSRLLKSFSYTVKYSQYLSFLVFLFFAYRWFFSDGDKKANEFGKPVKQTKISKWFMLLPLFFVTYIIFFPWFVIIFILTNQ